MGRKTDDFPDYMTRDWDRGGFVVRNPLSGKRKRFQSEKEARDTAVLVAQLVRAERRRDFSVTGRPLISKLIELWREERLPLQPWDTSTRKTAELRLRRINAELGPRVIEMTDSLVLEQWLKDTARNADTWNKWRAILVHLWAFAVARKLARSNEAEKVEPRSTSRKIEANRKKRSQLDVEGYKAIHAAAPGWLRLAMDLSLVTLQSRREICGMRHTDFRDGYVFVIRDKVAGDSQMAFIKIRLTPEIESLRARAVKLDDCASPYLVHRRPARMQRRWTENKAHWTYVNEHYLSQTFAAARDTMERFAQMSERERPTFHEIRGLGSRLYLDRGYAKTEIQALMTHSSKRTTEIYLERGAAGLTDDDYLAVKAGLSIRELLAEMG